MSHQPSPLLGLAVGDALGGPFETRPYDDPHILAWDGNYRSWEINTLQPNLKIGNWTDDTKMSLALATSLIEAETYDPVKTLVKYMEWYDSQDHRGMGKTIKAALERVAKGHHWDSSGMPPYLEGNGTAMRAAPIGAFYKNNPLAAANMARVDASLTHKSTEAEEGSAAVAAGVALLCAGVEPALSIGSRKALWLRKTLSFVKSATKVCNRLYEVQGIVDNERARCTHLNYVLVANDMCNGAHVVGTIGSAVLCFMVTESFRDAITLAVRAGGDTDTRASITGAFAGAFYGRVEVEPYLEQLERAGHLGRVEELLLELAPDAPL